MAVVSSSNSQPSSGTPLRSKKPGSQLSWQMALPVAEQLPKALGLL